MSMWRFVVYMFLPSSGAYLVEKRWRAELEQPFVAATGPVVSATERTTGRHLRRRQPGPQFKFIRGTAGTVPVPNSAKKCTHTVPFSMTASHSAAIEQVP